MTFEETRVVTMHGVPRLMHHGKVLFVAPFSMRGPVTELVHRAMWKQYQAQLETDDKFLKSLHISPLDTEASSVTKE